MWQEVLTLSVIVVWVLTGLCLGIVMGRRGYSGFGWGVIGTVLGPLGVLAAVAFRVPSRPRITRGRLGRFGPGEVRVLAAVDGSSAAMEAAAAAAGLLGPRIGRFTIATVIPYDATGEVVGEGDDHLAAACDTVRRPLSRIDAVPSTVVLRGAPADALRGYATEEDFDSSMRTAATSSSRAATPLAAAQRNAACRASGRGVCPPGGPRQPSRCPPRTRGTPRSTPPPRGPRSARLTRPPPARGAPRRRTPCAAWRSRVG